MSPDAVQPTPVLGNDWRTSVRSPRYLCEAALTVLLLFLSLRICTVLMHYAEMRPAGPLNDPILAAIGPIRLTWPIFVVLWSSIIAGLWYMAEDPVRLLMGFQAAALLMFFRTIALYLMPLEPLPTIIPLADPIAIYLGTGKLVTKDLFFSGHTSVMFLLFLTANYSRFKWFLLAGTIFVGTGVALQHVHYSGDVYAAPFFAYASWRLVLLAHKRFK
jgi:hypothetical protein